MAKTLPRPFALSLVVALLAIAAQAADADQRPEIRRRTLGIALEGGGAKGLAHIGVLQWFEEHRVPVDFIAGTSMGGLVGGLYATGNGPAEIRKILDGVNWREVLSGQTPYRELAFRRKEDLRAFPNYLEFGLRNGFRAPGGLNSGQAVKLLIDRHMLPYSLTKSFDDLPTPFRCVATDLTSGEPHVFASGSLASALRATMSLPGVFAPVKEQGTIYTDGGLLDNLPVDVTRGMGAGFVVGSHLDVGRLDEEHLRSWTQVAMGSTGVMIDANVARSLKAADLVIAVDARGFSTLDFSRTDDIVRKGYEAAEARKSELLKFQLSEDEWKRHLAERQSRQAQGQAAAVEFIEVVGTSSEFGNRIRHDLEKLVGRRLDYAAVENELRELAGLGLFNTLSYDLVARDGRSGLRITVEEKGYGPPFLKPGFSVNGAEPDDVGFTFGSRLIFLGAGDLRSEGRIDFELGSSYGIRGEYYRRFSPQSRWFVAPQAGAARRPLKLYAESEIVAEYRVNTVVAGVDAGYSFNRSMELRAGYQAGYVSATQRIGAASLPSPEGRTGVTRVRFALDRLDNPIIPRSGTALLTVWDWVDANGGSGDGFPSAETSALAFKPVSRSGSVYGIAAGGTIFGSAPNGLPQFSLGQPSRLAAYGLNELLTNQYFYFRLGYLHRLAELPSIVGGGVYLATHYEVAKAYGLPNAPSLPQDAVLGAAVETLIGPIMIGGSVGDSGRRKWFFQLGRIF